MCGIAAYFSKTGQRPDDWREIQDAAARRGCHAFGYARLSTQWARHVEPDPKQYHRLPDLIPARAEVWHFRLATWGGNGPESIQPFVHDGFCFAHNGNVPRTEMLEPEHLRISDSWAALAASTGGLLVRATQLLERLAGSNFSLLLSDGFRLALARRYHPMFLRETPNGFAVTSMVPESVAGFRALDENTITILNL